MTAKDIIWVWVFAILCSSFALKQTQKILEFKKDILNEKEIDEIIENELNEQIHKRFSALLVASVLSAFQ